MKGKANMAPCEARAVIKRTHEEQAEEDAFQAVFGRWLPLTPAEVAVEMAAFTRPWWIVGGWAIEAATGYEREHEDIDLSIFARDVPTFVAAMAGRWHVWNIVGDTLRPLTPETVGTRPPDPTSQLWLRRDAASPWVVDIPLTPDIDGHWTHKFVPDLTNNLDKVTFERDGIRYLAPELVLLYKARLARPKDDPDFEAVLNCLTPLCREELRVHLERLVPGHRWLSRL